MAPDEELKKRVARKLTRRRKEGHQVTMELPERFRDGDDADEDCTAPHGKTYNMNQSVFGMIAAAGSQVDFNARFDAQSSDEEDDPRQPTRQSSELHMNKSRNDQTMRKFDGHRRKLSESKLIRSFSRMGSRSKSKSTNAAKHSRTPSPVPEPHQESTTSQISHLRHQPKDAPVMSRMLDAKAELSLRPSFDMPRKSVDPTKVDDNGEQLPDSLAERLMEIFKFENPEDVIEGKFSRFMLSRTHTNTCRIPLLANEECVATRLYVHHY